MCAPGGSNFGGCTEITVVFFPLLQWLLLSGLQEVESLLSKGFMTQVTAS